MYVTSSLSRPQPVHRTIRITRDACGMGHLGRDSDKSTDRRRLAPHNALVQVQARYYHCGEAASTKCLSAATFVSWPIDPSDRSTAAGRPNKNPTPAGHWRCGHADPDEDCVLNCPLPEFGHSEGELTIRRFHAIGVVQRKRC